MKFCMWMLLVCQHVSHNHAGREKELLEAQGLKEYLSCISGKLSRIEWMEKEIEKAKQLRDIEQENEYYLLDAGSHLPVWR